MTSLLNPCPFLLTLLALVTAAARAQTPVGDLAKPPADAEHLIISSTGGKHGDSWIWQTPDGTRMGRESMNLRGQVFETDSATKFGADGLPTSVTVRGFTPNGDAGEKFTIADGKANWKSPIDAGGAPYLAPSFYIAFGGPMQLNAQFVERLIASPDKSLTLLPGGKATAEKLTSLEIGNGDKKKTVTAWAISGLGNSPIPVWTNANNKFFGLTVGISWLPDGYESEREKLQKAQGDALAARMPALAKSLAKVPTAPVAFTNVKLFDADNLRFLIGPDCRGGQGRDRCARSRCKSETARRRPNHRRQRQDACARACGIATCTSATTYTGLQELSMGVTSVRDPGNDDTRTIDRRERAAKGDAAVPARLSVVADRWQRSLHRAGCQRRHEPGRSHRARRQGEGQWLHRRQVLRHFQSRVAASRASPKRTSSAFTFTATSRPASGRWTRSTPATTRSRTSTGSSCKPCRTM